MACLGYVLKTFKFKYFVNNLANHCILGKILKNSRLSSSKNLQKKIRVLILGTVLKFSLVRLIKSPTFVSLENS